MPWRLLRILISPIVLWCICASVGGQHTSICPRWTFNLTCMVSAALDMFINPCVDGMWRWTHGRHFTCCLHTAHALQKTSPPVDLDTKSFSNKDVAFEAGSERNEYLPSGNGHIFVRAIFIITSLYLCCLSCQIFKFNQLLTFNHNTIDCYPLNCINISKFRYCKTLQRWNRGQLNAA